VCTDAVVSQLLRAEEIDRAIENTWIIIIICLHSLPSWLQQRAHCPSKLTSWPNVRVLIISFFRTMSDWSIKFGNVPDVLPGKQPFWDRPGVLEDKALVEANLHTAHHQASFLAASSQHSGDWLFALPIASRGLKLDDEAVRVAVGLRLGLDLCIPHNCHCGSPVDTRGLHSFVCKRALGRSARHHALNDW